MIANLQNLTHTTLQKRCHPSNKANFFLDMLASDRTLKPKVLEKFTHGQACFKVLGFEQKPFSFGISEPLCPRCGKKLIERPAVLFPGIIRIKWVCHCGFLYRSKQTLSEVKNEAVRIGGLAIEETTEQPVRRR
jgi:hypothetical protein